MAGQLFECLGGETMKAQSESVTTYWYVHLIETTSSCGTSFNMVLV